VGRLEEENARLKSELLEARKQVELTLETASSEDRAY
jgi:hypothetical protein